MKWTLRPISNVSLIRCAALAAVALSSLAACENDDLSSPGVIGAQWYDGDETVVTTLDVPAPQEVIDRTGAPVAYGAEASLPTSVTDIQVLFNEPLNRDVLQDLTINVDEPVDPEGDPNNRQTENNPGVIDITGREGLVDIVRVATGEVIPAVATYLNNIRAIESVVFRDVGISLAPSATLPSGEEFQVRVYAGVIEDLDGNRILAADRTEIPAGGGREEVIGKVADAAGRGIAAVVVFLTDAIAVTSVTAPALPSDASLVVEDDPTTYEDESAILVEFNTDVSVADSATAFTLVSLDDPLTPLAVTVTAFQSGPLVDEESGDSLDPEPHLNALQVVPAVPLAAGDYELRIDPSFADAFGNTSASDIQIVPLTVE